MNVIWPVGSTEQVVEARALPEMIFNPLVRRVGPRVKVGAMERVRQRGVTGTGYEGREITSFVADLVDRGITRLVDVRLTPISRKPGFSKSALRTALADAGITYEHRKELGNPKENRPGFAGSTQELSAAKSAYARRLNSSEAQAALADLRSYADREYVALLCFESDQNRCHRDVVLGALSHQTRDGQ